MIPTTTLRKLRQVGACKDRYAHLRNCLGKGYGDDTPISLITILEHNGLNDVLWIPENIVTDNHTFQRYRLFAVACCQDVLHLMHDARSVEAVKISHLYAHGEATDEELDAAWDAARGAAWDAARYAARYAARDAARDAAWYAAWDAARYAARYAARDDAARKKQTEHFRVIFGADF